MCDWTVIFYFVDPIVMYIIFTTQTYIHLYTCLHYQGTTIEISPWAFMCYPFDMYFCMLTFVHVSKKNFNHFNQSIIHQLEVESEGINKSGINHHLNRGMNRGPD